MARLTQGWGETVVVFAGENVTGFDTTEREGITMIRAEGPANDNPFFGFGLTDFVGCAPGQTLRLQIECSVTDQRALQNAYICLREWVPNGDCTFQVTQPLRRGMRVQDVSVYLTAREAGLVYQGTLMVESAGSDSMIAMRLKSVNLSPA